MLPLYHERIGRIAYLDDRSGHVVKKEAANNNDGVEAVDEEG